MSWNKILLKICYLNLKTQTIQEFELYMYFEFDTSLTELGNVEDRLLGGEAVEVEEEEERGRGEEGGEGEKKVKQAGSEGE